MDVLALHSSCLKVKQDILTLSDVIRRTGRDVCLLIPTIPAIKMGLDDVLESHFKKNSDSSYVDALFNFYKACENFSDSETLPTEVLDSIDEFQAFFKASFSQDTAYIRNHIMGYAGVISALLISDFLKKIGFYNHCLDVKSYLFATSHYGVSKLDCVKSRYEIEKSRTKGLLITASGVAFDGKHYVTYGLNNTTAISLWVEALKVKSLTYFHPRGGLFQIPNTENKLFFIERCSYDYAIKVLIHNPDFFDANHVKKIKSENIPLYLKRLQNEPESSEISFTTSIGNYREIILPKDVITLQEKNVSFFSFILEGHENDFLVQVLDMCNRFGAEVIWNSYTQGDELSICIRRTFDNFEKISYQFSQEFLIMAQIKSVEILTAINLENKTLAESYLYLKRVLHYQKSNEVEKWILK